ncbi:GNAT family N-acetyltransferase [Actinoplanes sp. NPDC023801]|uniref:GNAT family N-acetyltransferase n=1 Tax=Actinoplanes sp. NPDC023801 TaxID=3154595 RepID=UPI00340BFDD5
MISPLTAGDLDTCATLFARTFSQPPWNETWHPADAARRLTDMLNTPRAHGVRATTPDGQLTGFALGHLERYGTDDHFFLQEMCVDPTHQRRRIGTRLLEALAQQLPDIRHWYLLTARDSPAAHFYQAHGFRPAGRSTVYGRVTETTR